MKYWIYRNLRTKTWSVKQGGRVISHPKYLYLKDIEFRVWQGTLQRIRREGRKSVGAFVITENIVSDKECDYHLFIADKYTEVTFNPYKHDSFVIKATEEPIFTAERCVMTPNMRVWIHGRK